jgi:Tol biopolymer transport system component
MVWHTVLGIEVNTEALLSPTHLTLALGIVLIVSAPLRAAWLRSTEAAPGWKALAPAILSLLLVFAMFNFFTQFAHPFVDVFAAASSGSTPIARTHFELYQMRPDGRMQTRIFADPGSQYDAPVYSPDGKKIAYNADLNPEGASTNVDIYLANADGTNPTRLTNHKAYDGFPSWSPDGKKLAFVSLRDGNPQLYVMDADGTNQRRLTNNQSHNAFPSWSPDGAKIVYQSDLDGKDQIYVINVDGTNPTRLTNDAQDDFRPEWSPDGKQIAFTSTSDGNNDTQIYIMNADGTNPTRLTQGKGENWFPVWSPDSHHLLYLHMEGNNHDIYLIGLNGGDPLDLTNFPPGWFADCFSWSPDGNRIVYSAVGPSDNAGNSSSGGWQVSLGVAGILLQTALMMGFVLLALRRWILPFGAITLLFTVNAALVSLFKDRYYLIVIALLAGLVTDLLLRQLRPSIERILALRVFAFVVPAVLYGLYFLELVIGGSIVWSVPLWSGSIFLAGVVGLVISYLVFQPRPPKAPAVTS